ncbi:ABC transporter permease [Spiribacter halobius]|uniref:ABC transporter permease n=1 Tax=Sediminicurvatus halobius TaxID=2182432 RepID=UPI001E30A241|nr:FtsX-like permease family protein [Spiribacter halobius]UEX78532.1 ABC transporter permease [Spiribacter halobius]
MSPLLLRTGWNDLRRHPLQTLLAVIGVAVAVAVVVAVDLANHSALQAMRVSLESVSGTATHQIVGGPDGIDERAYTRLRTELGVSRAAPVVEGGATVPAAGERPLTLLGVDPFAEGPFRRPLVTGGEGVDQALDALLLRDDAIALGSGEARRLGVDAGERLRLAIAGEEREVIVAAVIPDPQDQWRGLALADIAAAQALLGETGRLGRIDLILDRGEAEALAERLPDGLRVVPAGASANAVLEMSRAFRINLTALSLLAVVVGAFLVFNTLAFLAVRRRAAIGTLRALGVQRREILAGVLADALLIGAVGTVLGLALGIALAHGLVGLVLQTITDLYFRRAAGELVLAPWSLAAGVLVGLGGSVLAALAPAQEAAATPPRAALARSELEDRARRLAGRGAAAGAGLLLAGGLLIAATGGLVPAFAGLFALILGAALLAPGFMLVLGRAVGRLTRGRPLAALAVEGAVASLSRTGVAVAALSVAVAAVIGVAVMIASFRASVVDWLEGSLAADFYVSAPAPLDDALAERLAGVAGVDWVARSRWYRVPTASGPVQLWALELPPDRDPAVDIRAGEPRAALQAFEDDRAVLVSEPFAARRGLAPGDALTLPTPSGDAALTVAGVYRDYGSPGGVVLLRRALYRTLYGDARLSGLGVHVAADAARPAVREALEAALAGVPGARLQDNAAVLERSLEVFDRTFAITEVLRWLAGFVAFVGVVSALMALHLDRARELAVLRAVGLGRRGVGGLIGAQSGLLGLAAGLWAVPLGLALAALLVFVINRRAFGWTMGFHLEVAPVVEGVVLAVVAALLAAVIPAWRAARSLPAAALKDE